MKEATSTPHRESIEEIITSGTLTTKELLLLKFTLDTEIRSYGLRWMEDQTLQFIVEWEYKNNLIDELSKNL